MRNVAHDLKRQRHEGFHAACATSLALFVLLACKANGARPMTYDDAGTTAATVTASTASAGVTDEAADVIAKCGKPDHDFTKKEGDGPMRHLVYKKANLELLYMVCAANDTSCTTKGQTTALVGRFPANDDPMADPVSLPDANRRLACAKGALRTPLETP
jgi:hypothetical protein